MSLADDLRAMTEAAIPKDITEMTEKERQRVIELAKAVAIRGKSSLVAHIVGADLHVRDHLIKLLEEDGLKVRILSELTIEVSW